MAQPVIVFVSVLKPVTDPRVYDKLAHSVGQTNKYKINIIGFASKKIPEHPPYCLYPLFQFHRLSGKRFFASLKIYKKLLQLKPDLIVANTHETLIVSCIYKIMYGAEICYDVQENYYRNLVHEKGFANGLKHVLAAYVRLKEWITRPLISQYLLAEKGYKKELPFTKGKRLVLENKFKGPESVILPSSSPVLSLNPGIRLHLIFTGTLLPSRGVLTAINFTKFISKFYPVSLKVVGHFPQKYLKAEIDKAVDGHPAIDLQILNAPLPYDWILKEIIKADAVLMPLFPDKSTENKIPTKLYEALALRKPIVMPPHPLWMEVCAPYKAAVTTKFTEKEAPEVLQKLLKSTFYTTKPEKEVLWEGEAPKWVQLVEKMLSKKGNTSQ